jgi:hypothetical protein
MMVRDQKVHNASTMTSLRYPGESMKHMIIHFRFRPPRGCKGSMAMIKSDPQRGSQFLARNQRPKRRADLITVQKSMSSVAGPHMLPYSFLSTSSVLLLLFYERSAVSPVETHRSLAHFLFSELDLYKILQCSASCIFDFPLQPHLCR